MSSRSGVPASGLDTPEGFLAAILVLDQFPRNMFRADALCFATYADQAGDRRRRGRKAQA